jgi:hypothetical protein
VTVTIEPCALAVMNAALAGDRRSRRPTETGSEIGQRKHQRWCGHRGADGGTGDHLGPAERVIGALIQLFRRGPPTARRTSLDLLTTVFTLDVLAKMGGVVAGHDLAGYGVDRPRRSASDGRSREDGDGVVDASVSPMAAA